MSSSRQLGRLAALVSISALVMGACGATPSGPPASDGATGGGATDGPASSGSPSPAAGASGLVEYTATADLAAGAQAELDLNRQLRDEAGMVALLGEGGADAFAALDALEAKFGRKILEDAAGLPATARVSTPTVGVPLRSQRSSGQRSAPAARAAAPVETSIFADTGFTTSALMSMFAGVIRLAGQDAAGSLPRQEHFTENSGGFRQEVDLNSTITVQGGGGHVSGDVQLSATDRIFKADGTFVALYTSSASGHFDANACPDGGGLAKGSYSFTTKHELNDVGGNANVQSGAGRSASGPFQLQDGDDARLQTISATLALAADAHGPGSPAGPGPTGPFDGSATQTVNIVMPTNGGTTQTGDPATVTGTGGAAASGSLFVSQAMAQLFLGAVGREAETYWRSGECVELVPSRDTGTVQPEEKIDLTVTSKAKFDDRGEIKAPIVATFSGKASLDPHDQPQDPPAHFAFKAGKDEGDKGIIDLKQTSRRGIGKRQVVYTVSGKPLLVSVTSKSVANIGVTLTYLGTVKDLKVTSQGDAYQGTGPITVKITLKLSAPGASCDGSASKDYTIGIKARPIPKPSDRPDAPDELDLSFDYPMAQIDQFTVTCESSEGTGSMPAPWSGLLTLLPPPGEAKRVTVGESTSFTLPGPDATRVTITVKKAT